MSKTIGKKTVVFKPEFETKLKKLRIKTKFVKNLHTIKDYGMPYNIYYGKKQFENAEIWSDFICYAFSWDKTPEGEDFWYNIYKD